MFSPHVEFATKFFVVAFLGDIAVLGLIAGAVYAIQTMVG